MDYYELNYELRYELHQRCVLNCYKTQVIMSFMHVHCTILMYSKMYIIMVLVQWSAQKSHEVDWAQIKVLVTWCTVV